MAELKERVAQSIDRMKLFEAAYETTTVAQIIAAGARAHGPRAVAIDFFERGQRATYEEVDRGSTRYANMLRTAGIRKGDRIGIMLPNRLEYALVWFACAKLGAVAVPINMRYTPREIEFVMADTLAKFAVVDESVWPTFSAMEPWPKELAPQNVFVVGSGSTSEAVRLRELLATASDATVEEDVQPDDLLNIQYTSGTTGFPKGCMLTHEYWSLVSAIQESRLKEPASRHLCWSPLFYADGEMHLLTAWRSGATLYLAEKLSSTRFVDWLKTHCIEWVSFPELVARQSASPDDAATCLKQVHMGGAWQRSSIDVFRDRFGVVPGHGFFGMTETGFGTVMPNDIVEMVEAGSCGLSAPFRELKLMNEQGLPTPIGEAGELWIRGRGMMKGYWNRPEVNAELFEGEWFKTGDLLRRDELGFFWFVGRTKDMIRRSNENIAAREVEAVIREIPEVADVAAVPVKDLNRGEEVKIWVQLRDGLGRADVSVEQILEHARSRLAGFKVPRYITFIHELPRLNTSHKVIKRELTNVSDPLADTYDSEKKVWN